MTSLKDALGLMRREASDGGETAGKPRISVSEMVNKFEAERRKRALWASAQGGDISGSNLALNGGMGPYPVGYNDDGENEAPMGTLMDKSEASQQRQYFHHPPPTEAATTTAVTPPSVGTFSDILVPSTPITSVTAVFPLKTSTVPVSAPSNIPAHINIVPSASATSSVPSSTPSSAVGTPDKSRLLAAAILPGPPVPEESEDDETENDRPSSSSSLASAISARAKALKKRSQSNASRPSFIGGGSGAGSPYGSRSPFIRSSSDIGMGGTPTTPNLTRRDVATSSASPTAVLEKKQSETSISSSGGGGSGTGSGTPASIGRNPTDPPLFKKLNGKWVETPTTMAFFHSASITETEDNMGTMEEIENAVKQSLGEISNSMSTVAPAGSGKDAQKQDASTPSSGPKTPLIAVPPEVKHAINQLGLSLDQDIQDGRKGKDKSEPPHSLHLDIAQSNLSAINSGSPMTTVATTTAQAAQTPQLNSSSTIAGSAVSGAPKTAVVAQSSLMTMMNELDAMEAALPSSVTSVTTLSTPTPNTQAPKTPGQQQPGSHRRPSDQQPTIPITTIRRPSEQQQQQQQPQQATRRPSEQNDKDSSALKLLEDLMGMAQDLELQALESGATTPSRTPSRLSTNLTNEDASNAAAGISSASASKDKGGYGQTLTVQRSGNEGSGGSGVNVGGGRRSATRRKKRNAVAWGDDEDEDIDGGDDGASETNQTTSQQQLPTSRTNSVISTNSASRQQNTQLTPAQEIPLNRSSALVSGGSSAATTTIKPVVPGGGPIANIGVGGFDPAARRGTRVDTGYQGREPALEQPAKISGMTHNFMLTQGSLYAINPKDNSINPQFPIPLERILSVDSEIKIVNITYLSKTKNEIQLTDVDVEFNDASSALLWSNKLFQVACKGNTAHVTDKLAMILVDQQDKKAVLDIVQKQMIPLFNIARKPFDVLPVEYDVGKIQAALATMDMKKINAIACVTTKKTSTAIDECLTDFAKRAMGGDETKIKFIKAPVDPVDVSIALVKEPLQYSQLCVLNAVLKNDKGKGLKHKLKRRTMAGL
ncbi:hypothetical protein HDU76_013950 [Blyttiomyces sp. JEL0837]|nr:hypothetical protein HDU76_013950 [Blyttiomyces sp. JEL0837]